MAPKNSRGRGSGHGCMTCKARHVRCDQQKPACGQCTTTGRKCDGYTINLSQRQLRQNVIDAYQRSTCTADGRLILPQGDPREREYISFFCSQTSRAIVGYFMANLWDYLLPQLTHSEPVVRHAVAAVGAAHQRYRGVDRLGYTEAFMLNQYNKSIRLLVQQSSVPGNTKLDLTLITCGLFVFLELLRGNVDESLRHIEAGLNIFARSGPILMAQSVGDSQTIYKELRDMFFRLNIYMGHFAQKAKGLSPFTDPRTLQISADFTDISDARHCLTSVMTYCVTLSPSPDPIVQVSSDKNNATQSTMLKQTYQTWLDHFERFLQTPQGYLTDRRFVVSLHIDYILAVLWTFGNPPWKETDHDRWNDHYMNIVSLAEELILLDSDSEPTFRLHALPALQMASASCRLPLVRRKALQLLASNPSHDCLYNWRREARIGEAIMNLEEAQLSDLPVEQRIPGQEDRVTVYKIIDSAETKQTRLFVRNNRVGDSVIDVDWS
ncbi:hypothetical protein N7474_010329 [Penicillium riverlandense]|uniref:uncharacterized protein n=1 Tax=Penicillium riverlandense TaxID=1903569 RepID=UPI002547004F|nr:uncharacterized protein N7474_010329 [Penicillium riverlandense]KAJ5806737.1 hypothetical protein N7474_010329 [Penicillium riverlandense]